ncbi:MAG: 4Fe-4S ferredoxin [Proteobacteria bacterium]|nr:4Fe-4S ferredoxin [Desulfobulbaceae bacterium]MBU4153912.1 4Fe-4S ferredoxin [Pseudomonadota bacterium]MDP2106556.1 4Fe-4S ferredoxin [Desulfobulbaceae bacterium]
MQVRRKIIEIDENLCNGCGQCIVDCAESALRIIDGKARLVADKYCDGLGACLKGCPTGALQIIEREAVDFDEEAVQELLRQQKAQGEKPTHAHGCPSATVQMHDPAKPHNLDQHTPCQTANRPVSLQSAGASALSHWPVQIRLVPPTAPFLTNADLLIAADCVPIAYAGFHQDLLSNRVVMMGCPKFDDGEAYVQKITEILTHSGIKSLLVAIMEVPCCQGMAAIVKKAVQVSGSTIPVKVTVISTKGEHLSRRPL